MNIAVMVCIALIALFALLFFTTRSISFLILLFSAFNGLVFAAFSLPMLQVAAVFLLSAILLLSAALVSFGLEKRKNKSAQKKDASI